MTQRTIRSISSLFVIALFSAMIADAQSTNSIDIPIDSHDSWQAAQLTGASKGKLFIVTMDQPRRKQSCHIQSFTPDKLVCSRAIRGSRTYAPQQVLALIVPGDDGLRIRVWLGLNGGLGAAIWGTVVLAAACPACAVGTGIAALICFSFAGAIAYTDDQPDRLLYLAPEQHLSRRLGFVQY